MVRECLFILLLLCMCSESMSQADSSLIGTIQGYVIPLPWIDRNPRLRLGVEYHAADHKSYSLEIGYGNRHFNHSRLDNGGVWGQAYSFFEVRPEIKWFPELKLFKKENFLTPWYLRSSIPFPRYFALEMFYQEMHDDLENNDFNVKARDIDIAYDEASFKKIKIGAHAKVGLKFFIWKKVVVDIYQGFGLAYRKITYYNIVNPRPLEENGTIEMFWPESYKNEGAYFLIQFSFGVRVGYVFGKI